MEFVIWDDSKEQTLTESQARNLVDAEVIYHCPDDSTVNLRVYHLSPNAVDDIDAAWLRVDDEIKK